VNENRSRIDPHDRYPSDGLRSVEHNAQRVLGLLSDAVVERTRDCIQIDSGGDEGIVVLVTAEAIELRLPTVEWTMGAYGPAAASGLWKRISTSVSDAELASMLGEAKDARQSEFVRCRFCEQRFPPERRHGDVCHGCAERHLGVVH
jgi:hypothetical protein